MKSHSDYVEKLACIEPNIEVIGEYAGSISCIEVRCKICGNIWSPVASRLGKDPATKEKLKWMFYSDYLAEVV